MAEQREVGFKRIYAKMRMSDRKVYFDVELERVLSCAVLPNLGGKNSDPFLAGSTSE
jgi:hypothetical protein